MTDQRLTSADVALLNDTAGLLDANGWTVRARHLRALATKLQEVAHAK